MTIQILANVDDPTKNYQFEIVNQAGAIWAPSTPADEKHSRALDRLNRLASQEEMDAASYRDARAYIEKKLNAK